MYTDPRRAHPKPLEDRRSAKEARGQKSVGINVTIGSLEPDPRSNVKKKRNGFDRSSTIPCPAIEA